MKTQTHFLYLTITILVFCVFPLSTHAAKIYVNSIENPARVGDATVLKIMLDTEGKEINAVEGTVIVGKPAEVISIDEAGSIFSLWARKPSLIANKISFTGGSTAGVFGSTLKLFTVTIKPTQTKPIKISFDSVSIYLNDGKGTKINVLGRTLDIPISASQGTTTSVAQIELADTKAPAPFSIDLGKDPSLYNGKYFISFYALDTESGISTYEVTEKGYPPVRSGSTYVLQNQDLSGTIEVKATDKAGNVRIQKLDLDPGTTMIKTIMTVMGIIVISLYGLYFFLLKKK
jgi:hypothetical protein